MKELLNSLDLPKLLRFNNGDTVKNQDDWEKRRCEIKEILQKEEYGYLPPVIPFKVTVEEVLNKQFSGYVRWEKLKFLFENKSKQHSVPVNVFYPENVEGAVPFIVFLNFRTDIPDKYFYVEDILERGFGVATVCYTDVTADSNKWDGLAHVLYDLDERTNTTAGKLMIWSYMAQRIMDYLQDIDSVDKKNIAVMGHSRLGKTALLTAAFDERFAFACVNCSGCCGAALSRGKGGENLEAITNIFPFWFCDGFKKYANNEFKMPFDQHFLMSLVAPRKTCVGTAENDFCADTDYQQLTCIATDEVYKIYGKAGYIGKYSSVSPETYYTEGDIAFFNRTGEHFMSVRDWRVYMDYIRSHMNQHVSDV
ncbi:MAG: hypothetical protein SOZ62_03370 [Eubacteriales bacterium]|nr:hypothetical protein [Eubacteriales bacterium]